MKGAAEKLENNENQSSLAALFFVLRKRIVFILAVGVAAALVFAAFTIFFISPVYSSTAKFYVNNTSDQMTSVSQQDLSASKSLAESSIVIVRNSTQLLEKVIDSSEVDIKVEKLKRSIAAGTYSGTEAFYISVSSESPEDAYALAEAFYSVIPEAIPDIINKGDVSQMDPPKLAKEPDSPNVYLNALIGGFLGFAVGFLVFFLKEVLDNTIYSEDDIRDKFGYPIIGVIPTIVTEQPVKKSAALKMRDIKKKGGRG